MHTRQQTLWEWAGTQQRSPKAPPRVTARRSPQRAQARGELRLEGLSDSSHVFELQGHEQAQALHVALERGLGQPLDLTLTMNRRRMLSARHEGSGYVARMHALFVGCDAALEHALVAFIQGQRWPRQVLAAHVQQHRDAVLAARPQEQARARGRFHDLSELLDEVLGDLAELEPPAGLSILWGRHSRGQRSIRLGSYDFDRRLIRIHPALDQPWVPSYFVEYVIFHEVLHAILPPTSSAGRRAIHHRAFCAMERTFYRYEEALAWERANLGRLLCGSPLGEP